MYDLLESMRSKKRPEGTTVSRESERERKPKKNRLEKIADMDIEQRLGIFQPKEAPAGSSGGVVDSSVKKVMSEMGVMQDGQAIGGMVGGGGARKGLGSSEEDQYQYFR